MVSTLLAQNEGNDLIKIYIASVCGVWAAIEAVYLNLAGKLEYVEGKMIKWYIMFLASSFNGLSLDIAPLNELNWV